MRKKIVLALILLIISSISFFGAYIFYSKTRETSALQVTATGRSQVYLNNQIRGQTPYSSDKLKPGEYTVRIVPEGKENLAFEQKIKLAPYLLTAIDRTFRETELRSEGSILSLESLNDKKSVELVVLSSPDGASVLIDGEPRGVTPLALKNVTVSDHELTLKLSGFVDKQVRVKTSSGYKVVANVKLAISLEEPPEASPTASPIPTPTAQVRIKSTPTGFLRVRFEPSLNASEVARVRPGETFPLLEETSGWVKISLPGDVVGWVSTQYTTRL